MKGNNRHEISLAYMNYQASKDGYWMDQIILCYHCVSLNIIHCGSLNIFIIVHNKCSTALISTVSFLEAVVVIINNAKLNVQTANMNMYIIS
jgi:hypothetical protein